VGSQADQKVQGSPRRSRLGSHHALNVTFSERGDAFLPVLLAEPLEYPPASNSGGQRETGCERCGGEVARHSRSDAPWLAALGAELDTGCTIQRGLIDLHEIWRPWQTGQGDLLVSRAAEIEPRLSVSVNEAVHVFGRTTHHTRSHSFASVVSPG
jgi:hypothetical protein